MNTTETGYYDQTGKPIHVFDKIQANIRRGYEHVINAMPTQENFTGYVMTSLEGECYLQTETQSIFLWFLDDMQIITNSSTKT